MIRFLALLVASVMADASELADRLARWVTRNDPADIVDDFALWEAEQPVSLQGWRARRENTPPK